MSQIVVHPLPRVDVAGGLQLIPAAEIEPRPMDWMISDVFERNSLVEIFGPPGAGKSFTALDMACCIASGRQYHGRKVQQGPAVYIAGEGLNGIYRRLMAWCIANRMQLEKLPLHVSNMPVALTESRSLAELLQGLIELPESPEIVVIDTLARNFGPADENSTQDMTRFVNACDQIRLACNCVVMLVHHVGHGDQKRARGSSVLNGAIDSAFHVSKCAKNKVIVKCTKQKEAPEPRSFAFKFVAMELGLKGDDGSQVTSAVLESTDLSQSAPKIPQGKHQEKAMATLIRLYQDQIRKLEKEEDDSEQPRVLLSEWRKACESEGVSRTHWYEVKKALVAKEVVMIEEPHCWPISGV